MGEKPLVFLIHGMGVHAPGWSKDFTDTLNEKAANFQFFAGKSIADLIDFQEVTYDGYFNKVLDDWDANAAKILALAAPGQKELVEKALGWLDGCAAQKDNFPWTHVADVLLWRLAPYLKYPIKNHIAEQMTGKILARMEKSAIKSVPCAAIAHSLGTAVTHETLEDLARGGWANGSNGFDPRFFRLESLHMIANVSRILESENYPVYTGKVRPGPYGDADSYCRHYYTYRHEYDPFTRVRPFLPDWSPNLFDDKHVSHIRQPDVHDMVHYLLHPRVHITILRSLLGYRAVSAPEELKALREYKQVEIPDQLEKVRERSRLAIEAMGESPDIIDVMKGLALFFPI